MSQLCLILWDHLSESIASLKGFDPSKDIILLCETPDEATRIRHHKKKIAFLYAAMRHFADLLREKGLNVHYVALDDPQHTGTLEGEIKRVCEQTKSTSVVVAQPSEWGLVERLKTWSQTHHIPVHIREDDRFLCSIEEFQSWSQGKKQLRMEFFYRYMRKKYSILMEKDGTPVGGAWNYDKDNRQPPKPGIIYPKRLAHPKSTHTRSVLNLVAQSFPEHFGQLEPFYYAVTRQEALLELHHFIEYCLPHFGLYQDAMVVGEPYLFHSLISSYLNAGLLLPLEVCQQAEQAYQAQRAPLPAVEGFIRQILGWREYVRGIYWAYMPDYGQMNALNATRPLPEFYWTAQTKMFCVAEAVRHTQQHAYSHHIQRLMVTGNFALLAGLDVKAVQEWYLAVYSDAHEWVEMPNTLGMALFGDGGLMASKPYAASGKYIKRMSNFCQHCPYDPELTVGKNTCPFNALYWDFMDRHRSQLEGNQRMPYVFSTWEKFGPQKQKAIRQQAQQTLDGLLHGSI